MYVFIYLKAYIYIYNLYIYYYYHYHYYYIDIILIYIYNIYIHINSQNKSKHTFPTFPPWDMPSFSFHKNTKNHAVPCCASASPEFQPRPAWNSWLSSLPPAAPSRCAPPVLWSSLTAAWPTCVRAVAVGDVGSGCLTPVTRPGKQPAIENGHRNSGFTHEKWWIFP